MELSRYVLTVIMVCLLIPFLFYWPIVHGLIGFWRRLGPSITFITVLGGTVVVASGLYLARSTFVVGDLGTSVPLIVMAIVSLAASAWIRVEVSKVFPMSTLVGLPELAPEDHPQALVRSGIYARIRHPRYAQLLLALTAMALFANFVSAYVVWIMWFPGVYVLVAFEERELRQRFGEAYERYSREVPRFVPGLRTTRAT